MIAERSEFGGGIEAGELWPSFAAAVCTRHTQTQQHKVTAVDWLEGQASGSFSGPMAASGEAADELGGYLKGLDLMVVETLEGAEALKSLPSLSGVDILPLPVLGVLCFPGEAHYTIESMSGALGMDAWVSPEPLRRAGQLAAVFHRLLSMLSALPAPLITELSKLPFHGSAHALRHLLAPLDRAHRHAPNPRRQSFRDLLHSEPVPVIKRRDHEDEDTPLDPDEVGQIFQQGGEFSLKFAGYECREGQVAMAQSVASAFSGPQHAMVEAGTGIGKSLAYLVPAVLWATRNGLPVVVSTNTKNLQTQLFEKDLPLIEDVLGIPFRSALIKGRLNYLCIRKLLQLLRHLELEVEEDEYLMLAEVLAWAPRTQSGDLAETTLWERPGSYNTISNLTSTAEECPGRGCRHARQCFLRRARARSLAADVVVANHSLVFAEMNITSPALPEYSRLVFDEAHNLEAAATRHFAVELSSRRVRMVLRRLWRRRRRNRSGTGPLATVRRQIETGGLACTDEIKARLLEACDAAEQELKQAAPLVDPLMLAFDAMLPAPQGPATLRFCATDRVVSDWQAILDAREAFGKGLAAIIHAVQKLVERLRDLSDEELPFQLEGIFELEATAGLLRELMTDSEFVVAGDQEEHVYWIERTSATRDAVRVWAAPVTVARRLAEDIYGRKQSVVFCSATLSVRGSYDFLSHRIGTDLIAPEKLIQLDAGSPFNYQQQCAVMVPTFLPEPGDRNGDYATELGRLLAEVFQVTRGRGMVLFTSYDMLRRSTQVLQQHVHDSGMQVLAQGMSGSRDAITERFKEDLGSVLMGTHSFWEGVDVVGETLSCLVVARLPFGVHKDPIIEARCERVEAEGKSAFTGYTLPSAVIRFRQGFGRLIRHQTDRGIVIVADRRMVSKRYGFWFQNSLPARTHAFADRGQFLNTVERFMRCEG